MIPYALIVFAYLLGSIPVGVILARIKGTDPRKVGSGNIGATNVMRAAGKAFGALTLIGDILKGFLPVAIAFALNESRVVVAAVGLAAFVGHLFPLFLGFKGGKGVATALGVYLALDHLAVLIAIVVFAVILLKWRYVSLSSLVGVALMPFLLYLRYSPSEYVYLVLIVGALTFIKHRGNIRRLIAGTENKIGSPKAGKS